MGDAMMTENAGTTEQHRNFTSLREQGPFATKDIPTKNSYIRLYRNWLKEAKPEMHTKFRALRVEICEFLKVDSLSQISDIIDEDEASHNDRIERAYGLLGGLYEIEGSTREISAKIANYAQIADSVIDNLKNKELSKFSSELEMVNEISATSNPVDLLLIIFNKKYDPRARFEAKRKLVLMKLAASIDLREREKGNDAKFNKFLDFLKEYVWEGPIGHTETAYILSDHDPNTFACTSFRIFNEDEGKKVEIMPGQKLTKLSRRKFSVDKDRKKIKTDKNKSKPIYVTIRQKSLEAKVLKLLRKGEENPALAVDDDLGLLGVLDSVADVDKFQHHLIRSASRAGSLMTLEEISDTLMDGKFNGASRGSSQDLKARKFFVRMGGMRVEFMLHTMKTFLDYQFKRNDSHEEYEINRLFDAGVPELLFPESIYNINMKDIKPQLIGGIREKIEK